MTIKFDPKEWELIQDKQIEMHTLIVERIEENKNVTDGIYTNPITGIKISIDDLYEAYKTINPNITKEDIENSFKRME